MTPVFSYYMIRQSNPGASSGDDLNAVNINLQNTSTMTSYFNDLKLFFQRAGAFSQTVVLHVEPDLWGFTQRNSTGDNAATVPVRVASTGLPELAGLPENMAGFGRAVIALRNAYAPNVKLGYHLSVWGTGEDIGYTDPVDSHIDTLATRAANYYKSLGANYDIVFSEFSDRDAAFKQYQYGDQNSWWNSADYGRNVRFLSTFVSVAQKRVVMWQIPFGNTKMRAMNNTWGHYQDNRVEWLLDDTTRGHLTSYINAGVVAFLFGGGAGGVTCACDGQGDGVTNPAPINGNNAMSLSADDDGGFFRQKAAAYYTQGAMLLASAPAPATSTPTATRTRTPTPPGPTATRTATPAAASPTSTTTTTQGWTTSATSSRASMTTGQSTTITANFRNSAKATVLVYVLVTGPNGTVVEKYWDNVPVRAGVSKSVKLSWVAPAGTAKGTHTVKIGIFSPGWGTLYHWNDRATTFVVN
jgi:hypothetical protein